MPIMQPYSIQSTVVLVAIERASLQPAPATISRCMGLLFLMIWIYSETLTFSVFSPPMPKYLGWSFSQMPITASRVSRMEMTMPTGARVRKNPAEA